MLIPGIALGWLLRFSIASDNSTRATSPNINTRPTGYTSPNDTGLGAEESDPLEPLNGSMSTFNRKVDDHVLYPVAS
jgi:ABC-type transporter lipoprotein component MlaA